MGFEVAAVTNVAKFPFEKTIERVPNDPRQEFMFDCCDGLPPARQKWLILRARSPEVGFLDDAAAEILLDALGLRDA